jgi:phospholipid/cholesterol/gamma-HCH transport system substrate-binding protein
MRVTREAKIGFFAVICLASLFWGVSFLKGKNIFSSTNTYYAVFNRVDGLKPTNPVNISGYKVGTVKSIRFEEGHTGRLIVSIIIQKKYLIPLNSCVNIVSADLMGGKAIRLDLAQNSDFHKSGDTLRASIETSLLDQLAVEIVPMKEKAQQLIGEVEKVLSNLNHVMNEQNKENISQSISSLRNSLQNFEHISASMDKMINDDKGKLNQILSNVHFISENLKNNSAGIDSIVNNLASISDTLAKANITRILSQADSSLLAFNQISTKINAGQGTLGALIHNDTLYYNLEQSAKNLELLLFDMKVNPRRYINFSLIDFSRSRYVETKK